MTSAIEKAGFVHSFWCLVLQSLPSLWASLLALSGRYHSGAVVTGRAIRNVTARRVCWIN